MAQWENDLGIDVFKIRPLSHVRVSEEHEDAHLCNRGNTQSELRNCALATGPFLRKFSKYCFNTSNSTEIITVSLLFRRLKKYCFF